MSREDFEGLKEFKKETRKGVEKNRMEYALDKITQWYHVSYGDKSISFEYK